MREFLESKTTARRLAARLARRLERGRDLLDRRKQQADEDGDDGDHDQVTMHFQDLLCLSVEVSVRALGRGLRADGHEWEIVTSDGEHSRGKRRSGSPLRCPQAMARPEVGHSRFVIRTSSG